MTDEPKITLKVKLDDILQTIGNKVTSWSNTPSNDKYPSEKLVKDSLDEIKSALDNYGSFAELQNLINNTALDGTLILDKDYKNAGNEENIIITQNITIIGNGHTIDADSHNNIITINGGLTVKPSFHNVIFLNGVNEAEDGGAICSIENVDISNCSFINCNTSFGGGAVSSYGNVTIKDSIFINCTANDDGGAVHSYDGEIQDCLFINNHANFNGGAVYLISPTKHIKNSLFVNNTALNEGGGVSSAVNNYEVYNCTFDQISTLHNTVNVSYITSSSVPNPSSTTPSADTTNGSVGNGTTWARSNHTHPKSSLYAEASHTHSQYLTSHQDITGKEDKSNKVTSLSSSSTDTEYPSAKAVFNLKEELDDKFENCMKNTDFFDMLDCINVNFNNLDDIYLLDTVFNISNYNGLPSKNSSVVNDILRNNAISQIGLNKEFTPSTKYTLKFDYYTSVGNRNGFSFGADPSLEDGVSMNYSDTGLQILVDVGNNYVETFNGTSSPTNVYAHTSNLFTSGTHHIRIVRNNTNVTFYIDDVELYTYTNAKYNTIGLNKWSDGYNTISNIEIKIGD